MTKLATTKEPKKLKIIFTNLMHNYGLTITKRKETSILKP